MDPPFIAHWMPKTTGCLLFGHPHDQRGGGPT